MLHFFLLIQWLSFCTSQIPFQGQYYLLAHELINELCKSSPGDLRASTVTSESVLVFGRGKTWGSWKEATWTFMFHCLVTDVQSMYSKHITQGNIVINVKSLVKAIFPASPSPLCKELETPLLLHVIKVLIYSSLHTHRAQIRSLTGAKKCLSHLFINIFGRTLLDKNGARRQSMNFYKIK